MFILHEHVTFVKSGRFVIKHNTYPHQIYVFIGIILDPEQGIVPLLY